MRNLLDCFMAQKRLKVSGDGDGARRKTKPKKIIIICKVFFFYSLWFMSKLLLKGYFNDFELHTIQLGETD